MERVAYTPKEFAGLFGKSQSWGYRQIYSGAVSTMTNNGRTLIPASEVQKILGTASQKGKKTNPAVPSKWSPKSIRETLIQGSQSKGGKKRKNSFPGRSMKGNGAE